MESLEKDQIGYNTISPGPFGDRTIVYTDYTASGRSLHSIEEYIKREVLPLYANTHTGTSYCSRQTTHYREEARDIIRHSVNASANDSVLFTGNGCTGAIHKLVHVLNCTIPPVVLVGPFEHHSNLLPWREMGAEIVRIKEDKRGQVDFIDLEMKLKEYSTSSVLMTGNERRELIVTLTAVSNLTGVITDTVHVSCLVHQYGGVVFWDYASAAPYLSIDMNPVITSDKASLAYKDAIYFSMHKFVGGVDSPGILVAKKHLFRNSVPHQCGGGTVFFVTPKGHRYLRTIEMREEGGTPNIIGSIRAGLAMQLKMSIGVEVITKREQEICCYIYDKLSGIPGLFILGPPLKCSPRLPIFSLLFLHVPSGKYLHHNYMCSLLSDLFGIQARGGCSCAGPYAQSLLGIEDLAESYEAIIMQDSRRDQDHMRFQEFSEREILRPGVTRLSFPYFMSWEGVEFVVKAVELVAREGWKLLPQYQFDPESSIFWYHSYHSSDERKCLSSFIFPHLQTPPTLSQATPTPPSYAETLKFAEDLFKSVEYRKGSIKSLSNRFLSQDAETLRWFLLPSEALEYLINETTPMTTPPLFTPKLYTNETTGEFLLKGKERNGKEEKGSENDVNKENKEEEKTIKFHNPPKCIIKPSIEVINEYNMIQDNDKVLVCLSGGKDSLSLLHTLKQYQYIAKGKGITFTIGAVTVDPKSSSYNPRPLIPYLASLGIPYFYEEQAIMDQASSQTELESICSFCSRMKRGRLYSCARREGYNVLAFGQHLDDLAESFLMSSFHNGTLHTMKAHYTIQEGDLRVIRPFVYVRERDLNRFAKQVSLPVISENCPACFTAPKERERMKQLLSAQELLFPRLFQSLCSALKPLMAKTLSSNDSHHVNATNGINCMEDDY